MGIISNAIGGALGSAISAAKANKNNGSSSGGGGGSGGGSSGYVPAGTNTDESIRQASQADYDRIQAYKQQYAAAEAAGDRQGMLDANNGANAVRYSYGYTGGKDGSLYMPQFAGNGYETGNDKGSGGRPGGVVDNMYYAQDAYTRQMEQAAQQAAAALEAKKQQSMNQLAYQKDGVRQAGMQANTAAESAYYDLIDPNGANAEAMAARGLNASGLAESSMISAGNARQSALNANGRSVNEQLSEIDRAIENARLTGDIAAAEQMASYRQAVAQTGLQSALSIEQLRQQMIQNAQQGALSEAGLTGYYKGNQTMAGKESEATIAQQKLVTERFQQELARYLSLGYSQEQANLEATRLANKYQELLIKNA